MVEHWDEDAREFLGFNDVMESHRFLLCWWCFKLRQKVGSKSCRRRRKRGIIKLRKLLMSERERERENESLHGAPLCLRASSVNEIYSSHQNPWRHYIALYAVELMTSLILREKMREKTTARARDEWRRSTMKKEEKRNNKVEP